MDFEKRYYKKHEFCSEIGISNNTLSKWLRRGLPIITIEGVKMIDMTDAITFLDEHKNKNEVK